LIQANLLQPELIDDPIFDHRRFAEPVQSKCENALADAPVPTTTFDRVDLELVRFAILKVYLLTREATAKINRVC